jgi:hypothetical protein
MYKEGREHRISAIVHACWDGDIGRASQDTGLPPDYLQAVCDGGAPVSDEAADYFARTTGCSREWLDQGRMHMMSIDMAARVKTAMLGEAGEAAFLTQE